MYGLRRAAGPPNGEGSRYGFRKVTWGGAEGRGPLNWKQQRVLLAGAARISG
jgi:hypothetical protein